ncbi:PD-(D/E)XK nuclease-like domain-containing protein [Xanthobacter flavus]|uniref:PD-(D/E)XK nuclease-like domain-containing protein n=1 Tax=Xanthobacter flavus TaxID=281 RepID=UPI0037270378
MARPLPPTFQTIGDAAARLIAHLTETAMNAHASIPTVRSLKPHERVNAAGVYALDIDRYHSDCCIGPSISSSGLRTIEQKSPAHYWATSYLNPRRVTEAPSEALDFGQAAHTLLLGESGFRQRFAIRPDDFPDFRTKAAQAWREDQRAAGRVVLLPEQVEHIKGIAAALARHPLVRQGLLQGEVERSLIWPDPAGVWLKSRPDVVPVSDGVAVDLKTAADASPRAMERAILDKGYAMQGALTGMALKAVCNIEMTAFVLVAVEKAPPYAVSIIEVDASWLGYARRQVRRAIETFARCLESGEWPAFEGEAKAFIPEWLRKRLDAETDVGLLPQEDAA